MPTILVVEDEAALRETLVYNLERQEYTAVAVADGEAAVEAAFNTRPDLILLDLMLPKMDGYEVCRAVRQKMSVPIIMLTARTEELDRVIGLELGADDYITKPFSMRELMARVKAHLRRERLIRDELAEETPQSPKESLTFDDLTIDLTRREVQLSGQPLLLKPKEYELLLFLANHIGQALTRDTLLERVWDWKFGGSTRTVDVHIRWLREKIENDPADPSRIITIRGSGYRFDG